MYANRLARSIAIKTRWFWIVLTMLTTPGCTPTESWVDEALLHDGRTVEVRRSVDFNFGQGELRSVLQRSPNQYSLTARNPDTGKTVSWSGERNFDPILLDFWEGIPYLVVVASSVFSNLKEYGCPEIPYVFLRYEVSEGRWISIPPSQFPQRLLLANLSLYYDGYYMKGGKHQSKEEIASSNELREKTSGGSRSRIIPTTFESWRSKYKNEYRVSHYRDGCRHTVPSNDDPSHPQSPAQPSQRGTLEVTEKRDFDPVWIIKSESSGANSGWDSLTWDSDRYALCRKLVQLVGDNTDTPELRGWLLFVNDPTKEKKARNNFTIFCNAEAVWFPDYVAEPGRVVLTKFSIAGDFLYKLSFDKPSQPEGFQGGIVYKTFTAKDGFLFFEWLNSNQSGSDRHIRRSMKVRIREPITTQQSNQ